MKDPVEAEDGTPVKGLAWLRMRAALRFRIPAVKELLRDYPRVERAIREIGRGLGVVNPAPLSGPGELFRALLCQQYGVAHLEDMKDPRLQMYVDYALSTVRRGEDVRNFVATLAPVRDSRYLDVGCAYGGFLAAFAAGGAREVVGIDISDHLLDYARALKADLGMDVSLQRVDVLDPRQTEPLGRFDIVTCNDVIEHVDDPRVGLRRLLDLLRPSGLLYLEIPNRLAASFIKSDGHFKLFGITALPKHLADRYFEQAMGGRQNVTYKSLAWYLNNLRSMGAAASLHNVVPANPGARLAAIGAVFDEVEALAKIAELPIDELLERETRRRARLIAAVFRSRYDAWKRLVATDPKKAHIVGRRLLLTFDVSMWRVTVRV